MDPQLNIEFLEKYAENLANDIVSDHFSSTEYISGKEILGLTTVKQINLFVLRSIFNRWQLEIETLKSPYFDYSDSEVIHALDQLKNILSFNINSICLFTSY